MQRLIGLLVLILAIIAIIDCLKSRLSLGKKIVWIILIILLPVLGMLLYFLLGRR